MRHLACLLLALCAPFAAAHDTWFERTAGGLAPGLAPGLELGTGNVFPLFETGLVPEALLASGCAVDGSRKPLPVAAQGTRSLQLMPPRGASDCWMQLTPFELTLGPALVDVYLAEVRPAAEVLARWRALKARGLPWRERYTKHARIALDDAPMTPVGIGMDAYIESRSPWRFRVLRDGLPLPGQAMELRHESTRNGFWLRTDAEGRLAFTPPLPGRWLLRGVDLRPAAAEAWDSRFVTLAFEVAAAVAAAPPVSADPARRAP